VLLFCGDMKAPGLVLLTCLALAANGTVAEPSHEPVSDAQEKAERLERALEQSHAELQALSDSPPSGDERFLREKLIAVTKRMRSELESTRNHVAGRPAADTPAEVYVYRKGGGPWIHPDVYCDGLDVARLDDNRFFKVKVDPGLHTFDVSSKRSSERWVPPVTIDARPGGTYFIRVGEDYGFHLYQVGAAQGRKELERSTPIEKKHVHGWPVGHLCKMTTDSRH
jgi:hypothetical protein